MHKPATTEVCRYLRSADLLKGLTAPSEDPFDDIREAVCRSQVNGGIPTFILQAQVEVRSCIIE